MFTAILKIAVYSHIFSDNNGCEVFTFNYLSKFCYLKPASALENKVDSANTVVSGEMGCFHYGQCNPFPYSSPKPWGYYMWVKPDMDCEYHFNLQADVAITVDRITKNHDLGGDPEKNCEGGAYIQYFMYHNFENFVRIEKSRRICGPRKSQTIGPLASEITIEGILHTNDTEGEGVLIKHHVDHDGDQTLPVESITTYETGWFTSISHFFLVFFFNQTLETHDDFHILCCRE